MPIGRIALGKTFRERRESLGLTQLDVAQKAGVNRRTVSKIERCKPTMLTLIGYVATALGIECGKLLEPVGPAAPTVSPATSRRVTVKLRFEVLIEDLDEATDFVNDFKDFLNTKHPAFLVDVDAGSLIVSLDMARDDVVDLLYRLCRGDLDRFGLNEIIIPDITPQQFKRIALAIRIWRVLDATHGVGFPELISWVVYLPLIDLESQKYGHAYLDEVQRLNRTSSLSKVIEWVKYSLTARSAMELNPNELGETFLFPNAKASIVSDGSVKVTRLQPRTSPLETR